MLVQGNWNKVRGCSVDERSSLFLSTVLEQLLAEIVSKGI
jgi:hypothetical protein